MKYISFITILFLLQSITLFAQMIDSEILLETTYRSSWALLIGINKYPNLPIKYQLRYAVNDVNALKKVLIEQYGFPESNIITLIDEQATRQNIIESMGQLTDRKKVDTKDRIIFYFSGHGQTVALDDGGEMGYLLPYDANVDMDNVSNPYPYYTTCIGMDELKRLSRLIPAKHVLFLIDSCYSGLAVSGRGGLVPTTANYIGKVATLKARQIITAGLKGDISYEDPDWGHGAFTYKLLEALQTGVADNDGDGIITGLELASHLRNVVPNISSTQTPNYGYFEGEGEFLFLRLDSKINKKSESVKQPSQLTGRSLLPQRIIGDDGAEMVLIPAGEFQMGSEDGFADEKPVHTVFLDAFYMDIHEVTNARYKKFLDATGYKKPKYWDDQRFNAPDNPVVGVSWEDAKAYCDWAGKRLPTEAEWEKAARGGLVGKKYPWGDDISHDYANFSGSEGNDLWHVTSPVGSFAPNEYGLYDMSGNVLEWCADWHSETYYSESPKENPTGPASGRFKVLRGGSWYASPDSIRISYRGTGDPSYVYFFVGFRCVASPVFR